MAYPQVTWLTEAFSLLEVYISEKKPFTSLDFKSRLRDGFKNSRPDIRQQAVGEFLRQAFDEEHMKGFEMQDNGTFRTYAPLPKKTLFQSIRDSFLNLLNGPKS